MHFRSKIEFKKLSVSFTQQRCRQRSSVFHKLVRLKLKFRKHCLTVQSRQNIIRAHRQKIFFFIFCFCIFQKILEHQLLVESRSDFRLENRIIIRKERIVVNRIPAVHRMTAFMSHCKHIANIILIVIQKNIRVADIRTA